MHAACLVYYIHRYVYVSAVDRVIERQAESVTSLDRTYVVHTYDRAVLASLYVVSYLMRHATSRSHAGRQAAIERRVKLQINAKEGAILSRCPRS